MKSTKNERTAAKDEYPCLKIHENGLAVLFTAPETGTVVASDNAHSIGEWSGDWAEYDFTIYHGTITLEN